MADKGYRHGEDGVHHRGYQARRQLEADYNGNVDDDDEHGDTEPPRTYARVDRPPAPDRSAELIGGLQHQALVRDLYADTRG